jgi:aerobic-type carbon monoxide dehydrogenase small subunit (CoxS/CutS family)
MQTAQRKPKHPVLTDAWIREHIFASGWVSQSAIADARKFIEAERRRDDADIRKSLKAPKQ